MKTINRQSAHKNLTTKHNTMRWETDIAVLSVRKDEGRYIVRLYDKDSSRVTKTVFKTLPGAMVCAENLREYYL